MWVTSETVGLRMYFEDGAVSVLALTNEMTAPSTTLTFISNTPPSNLR